MEPVEYRITATVAEHGSSDEWADKVLDVLLEGHADLGPVVGQDTARGLLFVTVALDATDPWTAANLAARVLAPAFDQIELPLAPYEVNVTLVEYEDSSDENVRDLICA